MKSRGERSEVGDVGVEETVRFAHGLEQITVGKRAERRAEPGGQERRPEALAHDVREGEPHAAVHGVPVVQVARDLPGGDGDRGDLVPGELWCAPRAQRALQGDGVIQLVLAQDLGLHPPGELAEQVFLALVEHARLRVEQAQRADAFPTPGFEGMSGVETQMRIALDEGVARPTLVLARVRDDDGAPLADREVAEGVLTRCLPAAQTDLGLTPLAVAVQKGDAHHRDAEHLLGDARDTVDALVTRRIENAEALDRALPGGVIERGDDGGHLISFRVTRRACSARRSASATGSYPLNVAAWNSTLSTTRS